MPEVVYEAHYDGLTFTFYDDGRAYVRLRREPDADPEYIFGPAMRDDKPFIMSHRLFNRMCKESIKEGDCDDLLARKADEDALRNAKKKHVEALYEAVKVMAEEYIDRDATCHVGICTAEECSRCGPILAAQEVIKAIDDDYKRRTRR